jgi:hypothetical protein
MQVNVASDIDQLAQIGAPGVAQSALAQGNTLANAALIVDLDTQSAYQMLGGEAYEDSFLVQANIVVDAEAAADGAEEDATADSGLLGVIVALTGESGDPGNHAGGENYGNAPTGAQPDMLGGVLA